MFTLFRTTTSKGRFLNLDLEIHGYKNLKISKIIFRNNEIIIAIIYFVAGALSPSQFPVFTLYAQKICVRASRSRCSRSWIFDRVSSHKLNGFVKKTRNYASREDCMASCIASSQFTCRLVIISQFIQHFKVSIPGLPKICTSIL